MNFLPEQGYKRVFYIVLYIAVGVLGVYLAVKYLLPLILPFIIAFAVAALLQKPVVFAEKKLKIPKKFAAAVIVVAFLAVVFLIIFAAATALIRQGGEFIARLSDDGGISKRISTVIDKIGEYLGKLGINYNGGLATIISDALRSLITSAASRLTTAAANSAGSLPGGIISAVVLILSSVYFCAEYRGVVNFLRSVLPERASNAATVIKREFSRVMTKYVRSYFLLFLLTFGELFLGLSLIGTGEPFLLALLIAVVDILPVLGTGIVLVPWAISRFILGDVKTGIFLLILYAAVTVIRQLVEPRIVGKGIGLHPAVSLMMMYVGLRAFGFPGMIAAPIIFAIGKNSFVALKGDGA